jgi:serine/threonine protein kinase/Tol biopolymer transport system component
MAGGPDESTITHAAAAPAEPHTLQGEGGGALPPGAHVGRYVIDAVLGTGGMGIVYRALDSELGRKVALKLVRPEGDAGVGSTDARARLLREARAMARLSHPNMIAVHDVGVVGDQVFFAMELVDGVNLAEWLRDRPRSWREVVRVFEQAGRGLEAAHAAGLVHRDFKPENVLVGRDGRVCFVDLGLARSVAADEPALPRADTEPAGAAEHLTRTGAIMGTPRYMAPEQHLGAAVDERADQFSFCVAFYEAIYGQHPFMAGSRAELAAKVVRGEVAEPPRAARAPRWLARVILRGLAPKPEARHASMSALLAAIDHGTRRRRRAWLAVAAVTSVAAAGAVVAATRPPRPLFPTEVRRQVTFTDDAVRPELSPDGKKLAFVTGWRPREKLNVQDLATGQADTLAWWLNTGLLRWSPTGDALLVSTEATEWGLALIGLDGHERRYFNDDCSAIAWSPDGGSFIAGCVDKAHVVDAASGAGRPLKRPASSQIVLDVDWDTTGRIVLLTEEPKGHALWTEAPDGSDLRQVYLDSVSSGVGWGVRWLPGERIAYLRIRDGQNELASVRMAGAGSAVEEGVILGGPDLGDHFSFSADGKCLAYERRIEQRNLVRLEPGSPPRHIALTAGTQVKNAIALSPDGALLAFAMGATRHDEQVFVMPSGGGASRALTARTEGISAIAWARDGRSLIYRSAEAGKPVLRQVALDGGVIRSLYPEGLSPDSSEMAWTPDGKLLYERTGERNFGILDPETGVERLLVSDESLGWMWYPQVSPDGRRVAVDWNRRSEPGLYVISIADGAATFLSPRFRPVGWSADGQWVYAAALNYRAQADNGIVRVPAAGGPAEPILDFAPGKTVDEAAALPDGSAFIVVEVQRHSDIWLTGEIAPDTVAVPSGPPRPPRDVPGHPEPPRPAPTNLGFEDGPPGGLPDGWHLSESTRWQALATLTDERPFEGKRCLRLGEGKNGRAEVLQYVDAGPYRGKLVQLRAAVRASWAPAAAPSSFCRWNTLTGARTGRPPTAPQATGPGARSPSRSAWTPSTSPTGSP